MANNNGGWGPWDAESVSEAREMAEMNPEYREQLKRRMLAEAEKARKESGSNGGAHPPAASSGCLMLLAPFGLLVAVIVSMLIGGA